MRVWHLVGLPGFGNDDLRFVPTQPGPLFLPSSIPSGDQEQILAFYQQVISDQRFLPRSEVDWHQGIVPVARKFLERALGERGSSGLLLVVKIRKEDVDLAQVLADPVARTFQHTVVTSAHRVVHPRLEQLAALTKHVVDVMQTLYEDLSQHLAHLSERWGVIQPLLATLSNPVDVIEAVNDFVDVQLEQADVRPAAGTTLLVGVDAAEREGALSAGSERNLVQDAVIHRTLRRQLAQRPPSEVIALAAIAMKQPEAQRGPAIKKERWSLASRALEAELLVRGGELQRWAQWLAEPTWRSNLEDALRMALPAQPADFDVAEALSWFEVRRDTAQPRRRHQPGLEHLELSRAVSEVATLITDRKLARAEEQLDALATRVDVATVPRLIRADYHGVRARYLAAEGRWEEALAQFQSALHLLQTSGATKASLASIRDQFARTLCAAGKWPEAETAFREALRLQEEGGVPPIGRAVTLHELARGLRDNGRWPEAETAFREALRLKNEGGATPVSRSFTLQEFARGLRDNGRWSEAETAFREALHLQEEGGATHFYRGVTLDDLARGLRDNGRWPEAETAFREALRLKEEGSDTTISRGITLNQLARGLRDNSRWPEAETAFREALRLKEEGGASPNSRAITLDHLARGLRDNGRWPEAEAAFREALRLQQEGGDTPIRRGVTLHNYGSGLRQAGRLFDAEAVLKEALALKQAGGDTAESIATTLTALALVIEALGRPDEAATLTERARLLRSKTE
jgi:tetratricopeptide (TPR) repeat protein